MDQINTTIFALLTGGTTAAVGILKKLFPKWVDGKEEALAQVVPILFIVIAKFSGVFKGTDWKSALLLAVGGGLGAGVIHDKLVNPVIKGISAPSAPAAPDAPVAPK